MTVVFEVKGAFLPKTSFDKLEDPDDASNRYTVLKSFQTVQRAVEIEISHSDFEELLFEVIHGEVEEDLGESSGSG